MLALSFSVDPVGSRAMQTKTVLVEALQGAMISGRAEREEARGSNVVQGRALLTLRGLWLAAAALSFGLLVYALPIYYERLRTLELFAPGPERDGLRAGIAQLHFSTDGIAVFTLAVFLVRTLGFFAVAALIFRAK